MIRFFNRNTTNTSTWQHALYCILLLNCAPSTRRPWRPHSVPTINIRRQGTQNGTHELKSTSRLCRPETLRMDPQQRLLLESAHESLTLAKSSIGSAARTSVMVGIGAGDYVTISAHLGVGLYAATGQCHIIIKWLWAPENVVFQMCDDQIFLETISIIFTNELIPDGFEEVLYNHL